MTQAILQPKPAWKVTLDGKDLTSTIAPRLISLTLTEDRGEKSDKLELSLHDHDGQLALPKEGARLSVSFGWEKGANVPLGLVSKGSFLVDEVRWSGPPDIVTISAHSADFSDDFRKRRNRTFHGKTLGDIVSAVAAANGLKPSCHPDLSGTIVTSAEQAHKSDMQFLRDLGRRYDAVATVKSGRLVFAPIDATTTAGGKAIPTFTITRNKGDQVDYTRAARESAQDGAEAQYFDQGTAKRHTYATGGTKHKRLKRVYASKEDATAAAQAEQKRLARAKATLSFTLAYGDARLSANSKAKVSGCKTEIDAKSWRIATVKHSVGAQGFTTELDLEVG